MKIRLILPLALAASVTLGGCHRNQPETEGMPAGVRADSTMDSTKMRDTMPTDTMKTPPRDTTKPPR